MRFKRIAAIGLVMAVALLAGEPQLARSDWRRVERIPAHQKITVHMAGGETVKGEFVEAAPDGLVVLVKGDTTRKLDRAQIVSIGKTSHAKGALLGLAAGVTVGGLAGALVGTKAPIGEASVRMAAAALTLAIGTGAGTGIGAAAGAEKTLWRQGKAPKAKQAEGGSQ